nr:hypothetical protein [Candidatus Eremiobacteraeota bacterium]
MRIAIVFMGLLLCTGLAATPISAAVKTSAVFSAAQAPRPLALDPSLSDPLWATGTIPASTEYENITTRQRAQFPTSVDLLYDSKNLYVGFHVEQG